MYRDGEGGVHMSDASQEGQAAVAARTQSLFRVVNERVKEVNEAFSILVPLGDWICECARHDCAERLALTLAEYSGLRAHPREFAVAPSDLHVLPDVERVVDRTDRFWVVEKYGEAGRLAEQVYTRAGSDFSG